MIDGHRFIASYRTRNALLAATLLLLSTLLFIQLGGYPLFDVDEGAFAEATREMVARGEFGFPTLDGAPRYDKPILIYWLQAASFALFGVNEWGARLPSAVAALLWVWATWHFARHRFGPLPAFLAGAMLTTALGPWAIGRAATADALLNLWLVLAAFDGWRALESGRRAPLVRAYLWMGLGFLTKGPVAVVVPGAAALLYTIGRGEWRKLWQMVRDPVGWLLFLALTLPWYSYALMREGWAFVDGFLFKHNLQRFADTLEQHGGPWWYYLVAIPLLLAPWSLLLFPLLPRALRDGRVGLRRFLWGWFLFVLCFFTLAQTKLPHYALYGVTPLVLLIAAHLGERGDQTRWWLTVPLLSGVMVALSAALPMLVDYFVRHTEKLSPFHRALGEAALAAWPVEAYFAGGATILVIIALWQLRTLISLPIAAALTAALLPLWIASRILPWAGELLQGPIVRAAVASRDHPVVNVGLRAPSFSFYRQAVTPKRPPEVGEWFVTRIDRLPEFPYQIHFNERGVVVGERTP